MFTVEIQTASCERKGGKRQYATEDEALRKMARVCQALEYDQLVGYSVVLLEDGKERASVTVE